MSESLLTESKSPDQPDFFCRRHGEAEQAKLKEARRLWLAGDHTKAKELIEEVEAEYRRRVGGTGVV